MIGFIRTATIIDKCVDYCLSDKKELSERQKQQLSLDEKVQHFNRAEILEYNKCFGNRDDILEQLADVSNLNKRVKKPLFHISLRLAPGDQLSWEQLIEAGQECAKEFGFADNQYITVLHKDTQQPHIHIVANRVGFDGKCASDSNSYKRMAALCRQLEHKHQLREVLSPRRFLPEEMRHIPRLDSRKDRLKQDIRQTLQEVSTYEQFEEIMKKLGYQVLKGRGITFIDNKKVRIKGSEVGFSLAKIERALELKRKIAAIPAEEKQRVHKIRQALSNRPKTATHRLLQETVMERLLEQLERSTYYRLEQEMFKIWFGSDQTEQYNQSVSSELIWEAKRKKKRKRLRR
jgi:Relaxase/Mobilisation nuclease domain.